MGNTSLKQLPGLAAGFGAAVRTSERSSGDVPGKSEKRDGTKLRKRESEIERETERT